MITITRGIKNKNPVVQPAPQTNQMRVSEDRPRHPYFFKLPSEFNITKFASLEQGERDESQVILVFWF